MLKGKEFIEFAMEHVQDGLVYIIRDNEGNFMDHVGIDPRDKSIIFSGGWLDQEDIAMMTDEGWLIQFPNVTIHPDLYVSVDGGSCCMKSLWALKKFVEHQNSINRSLPKEHVGVEEVHG